MSFRLKLFLSIAMAIAVTALVETGLDSFYDSWRLRLQARTQQDLSVFMNAAVAALDLSATPPRLDGRALETLPRLRGERLRVVQGDETMLTFGGLFPEDTSDWATLERFLGQGYRLDVSLPLQLSERVLRSNLLLDLLDLPLLIALGLGVALALTRLMMRPVVELTSALQQISRQQFPEPVPVPPGNDELSDMARSFNAMSASIQSLIERERSFTRYASHELRTPLSALKAHTEALELELSTADEAVPVLQRNIDRMEAILAALLALARSTEHDPAPVALHSILREALEGCPEPVRRRVTVLDRVREPVWVSDGHLMRQAVQNLVDNALKYSDGPVALILEAGTRTATVRVCDEGPGIPEGSLDSVRKPFVRGAPDDGGLGLGLALAENIARSMRGRLELSNTSSGLEAALTVPREDARVRATLTSVGER